jgi:hypothetical protein
MSELDTASIPTLDHPTAEEFAAAFTTQVQGLVTDARERQLARYELALEATRRPELQEALVADTVPVHGRLAEQLAVLDVPDPGERARDLLALLDGLLFSRLITSAASAEDLGPLVGRILRAVDVPLRERAP